MQTSQENQSSSYKNSTTESNLLVLERHFDAPIEQLFEAFKTKEALKAWWWPKTIYTDQVDLDFKKGGKYFINMKGFEHASGGMTGEFEEIITNERIVMSDHFSDEKGNAITAKEAKMPGVWPEVVYITFDFKSLGENKSSVKLSQQGIPNEMQKDCKQGWAQMFDKLEEYLFDKLEEYLEA